MKRLFRFSMTQRLLFLNCLIFVVFGVIIGIMMLAFSGIRELTTSVFETDIRQIADNARLGKDISRAVAKTNLLIGTFYKDENALKSGMDLLDFTKNLSNMHMNADQRQALKDFEKNLGFLLDQCAAFNRHSTLIDQIEKKLDADLNQLAELISEKIIGQVLQDEDTVIYSQLGALIPSYRETMYQVVLDFSRLKPARFESDDADRIVEQLERFSLRLRTLLASDPEVSSYGVRLLEGLTAYKSAIISFSHMNMALKERLGSLMESERNALAIIESIDRDIIHAVDSISKDTQRIISQSVRIVLIISATVIAVFGIYTYFLLLKNIRKPMESILAGIAAISKGDLEAPIRMGRTDEWNLVENALNAMTLDLKASYKSIQDKNQALENAHRQLEANIDGLEQEVLQRKRAEKAMQESEERYRRFFEDDLSAAFIADTGGWLIACNPSYATMFGFADVEDALTHNLMDVYPDDKAYEAFLHLLEKNGRVEYQKREFRRVDGALIYVAGNVNGTFDAQDRLIEIKGYLIDETARQLAETEKARLQEKLQQVRRMESLGTLAGGVAHDFNNLLMGIQGCNSLMLVDTESSHAHYGHLKEIEEYIRSAADLTGQLLGFARGGKYEVKTTDLNQLVKKQIRMFGRTRKEIAIHETYERALWPVEVDRGQIEQVLLNLFVNAWQAMPNGGHIDVKTKNVMADANAIQSFGFKPGRYVNVSVADTGAGMDREILQKVFDPFFTTKEKGRGTGLGLASTYGIIENHGGLIHVDSELGVGTVFELFLPASNRSIQKETGFNHEFCKGTGTLLLVDDEEMIIKVGTKMLQKLGYQVISAARGQEALEIFRRSHSEVDGVILDMIMPQMDGAVLFERLKEIDPQVKVILSSGYSLDGKAEQIMDCGCVGFLQKPFDIKELSQKIRESIFLCKELQHD